jgi:aarF domain-containing kinase
MPLTFEEFKRALVSQTDLRLEARNLELFNKNFSKNPSVLFPVPMEPYISASVLVETWEDGIEMTDFLKRK